MGIWVDKAERLAGGATNRHKRIDRDYLEHRANELDELVRRRAERSERP